MTDLPDDLAKQNPWYGMTDTHGEDALARLYDEALLKGYECGKAEVENLEDIESALDAANELIGEYVGQYDELQSARAALAHQERRVRELEAEIGELRESITKNETTGMYIPTHHGDASHTETGVWLGSVWRPIGSRGKELVSTAEKENQG